MNESKIDAVNPAVIFESLSELETIIDRGKQVFSEVGTALMKIRINQLYQSEYDNFDEYCQKHWGFNRDSDRIGITASSSVSVDRLEVRQVKESDEGFNNVTI